MVMHDPENGSYGDCMRTCLAMVLDMSQEDIPNFGDEKLFPNEEWRHAERDWLQQSGYAYVQIPIYGPWGFDWVLNTLAAYGDAPVIVSGKSPRGEWNHDVVVFRGKIFDPHPDDTGLVGPCIDSTANAEDPEWFWVKVITPWPLKVLM